LEKQGIGHRFKEGMTALRSSTLQFGPSKS
jgi:hypothetical protein